MLLVREPRGGQHEDQQGSVYYKPSVVVKFNSVTQFTTTQCVWSTLNSVAVQGKTISYDTMTLCVQQMMLETFKSDTCANFPV